MIYNELLFFNNSTIHVRFAGNFVLEKISKLLQDKGMKPERAIQRAVSVFAGESEKASLYLHNFQLYFDNEVMKKIYEYIVNKALFQEPIHFGSYDKMVRLTQQVYRSALSETELRQIKHISKANSYGVALVR